MTINLTKGQQQAFELIANPKKNILLLGSGGSGKSFLLNLVKEQFGHETLFGATTGTANQNLFNCQGGDGTAHKIFSLPTAIYNNTHLKTVTPYTRDMFAKTDAIKRVCIDEGGSLTPDQFDLVTRRVDRFNKKSVLRAERDIQLVLVGDLLQLPGVLKGNDLDITRQRYGTEHFFLAERFKELDFDVVFLGDIMRTEDEEFKYHLDVIRYYEEDKLSETLKYFNQFAGRKPPENIPLLSPYNKTVAQANQNALNRLPGQSGTYTAELSGDYNIKDCPVDHPLRLKVGLPVMTIKNHEGGLYQNGSMGKVVQMTGDGVYVRFESTGETHFVETVEFVEKESYISGKEVLEDGTERDKVLQREVGKMVGVPPIKIAAGLTYHKAQGRTIDSPCELDFGWGFKQEGSFGTGMAYVGLSRFTKPEHIYLRHELTKKHIKTCMTTVRWMKDHGFV